MFIRVTSRRSSRRLSNNRYTRSGNNTARVQSQISVNELYYTQRINQEINKSISVLEKKAIIPVLISLLGFVLILAPQCSDYTQEELKKMNETDYASAIQESEQEQILIVYSFVGSLTDAIYQISLIKRCGSIMAVQNKATNINFKEIFQKITRIRNHKQLLYTKIITVIYYSGSLIKIISVLTFFILGSAEIQIIQQWSDISCNIFVHIYYGFITIEFLIYIIEQTIYMINFKEFNKTNYYQMSRRNQIRVLDNEQNQNQNIQQQTIRVNDSYVQQNELNRDKLEVLTYEQANQKQYFKEQQEDKEEELQCIICLQNYRDNDEIIFLQCDTKIKHHFHFDCLNEWVHMRESQCPICRKNISEL